MSLRRGVVCLGVGLLFAGLAAAQMPDNKVVKTEAQLDAEATQADALYKQAQSLATLPMYEELHAARPKNPVYVERLAMAWVAKAGAEASPEQTAADNKHALELFKEAVTLGDRSDLSQVMIEKLTAAATSRPRGRVGRCRRGARTSIRLRFCSAKAT